MGELERLTARELDLLVHLARGLSYDQTARLMRVSLNTVRSHIRAVYGKLGVDNKTAAVLRALELGLIPSPGRGTRGSRT